MSIDVVDVASPTSMGTKKVLTLFCPSLCISLSLYYLYYTSLTVDLIWYVCPRFCRFLPLSSFSSQTMWQLACVSLYFRFSTFHFGFFICLINQTLCSAKFPSNASSAFSTPSFPFQSPFMSLFLVFGQRPRRGRSPVEHRGNLSVRTSVRTSPPCPILRALSPSGPSLTLILPNSPNPSNMAQI